MKDRKPNPIEEELGIEPIQVELEDPTIKTKGYKADIMDDYVFTRQKIYHAMTRSAELVDAATREMVANPSGIGVKSCADALTSMTNNTYRMLELHEKMRVIMEKDGFKAQEKDEDKTKMSFNTVLRKIEGGKR
jgi:hypothetical protein